MRIPPAFTVEQKEKALNTRHVNRTASGYDGLSCGIGSMLACRGMAGFQLLVVGRHHAKAELGYFWLDRKRYV
jgi:hypothetical protein